MPTHTFKKDRNRTSAYFSYLGMVSNKANKIQNREVETKSKRGRVGCWRKVSV